MVQDRRQRQEGMSSFGTKTAAGLSIPLFSWGRGGAERKGGSVGGPREGSGGMKAVKCYSHVAG